MLHAWQEGGGEPAKGSLGWAIDTHFGSYEALVQSMTTEGAALQGSGWVVSFAAYKSQYLFLLSCSFCNCCFHFLTHLCHGSGLAWTKNLRNLWLKPQKTR